MFLLTGEFNSYSSAFFLFSPWTALLIVLLPLEVIRLSTGLLLLVALLCMSMFHMDRTKLPASLKLFSHLECIILKSEKLLELVGVLN